MLHHGFSLLVILSFCLVIAGAVLLAGCRAERLSLNPAICEECRR